MWAMYKILHARKTTDVSIDEQTIASDIIPPFPSVQNRGRISENKLSIGGNKSSSSSLSGKLQSSFKFLKICGLQALYFLALIAWNNLLLSQFTFL